MGAGGNKVAISWKDGLPDDRFERAQIEQILVESDLTSRHSAIKRLLDGDNEQTREELERIRAEEGVDAARNAAIAAARGAPVEDPVEEEEEEVPPKKSESSRRTMARMKQERGQGDNQGGRQRKGPKLGG